MTEPTPTEPAPTEPAKFGRLAHLYCWIEYFSFGLYLQQCRYLRLDEMAKCRAALLYGDGDGRFLAALTRRAPNVEIVAVDASRAMLRRTASRLPPGAPVRLVQGDALTCRSQDFPEAPFDLVVSHFFLDCFHEEELTSLMARVSEATVPGAVWVISDFAVPSRPIVRTVGLWVIRGLYLAFGLLTGLRTRRLPNHADVMRQAGWALEDQRELLFGLLISQRWRRSADGGHAVSDS